MRQSSGPDLAIEAAGLCKRYRLGGSPGLDDGLRELTQRGMQWLMRAGRMSPVARSQTFWALRDVSFGIERGSAVGVVGHNGAGKSTLLKLLARITPPTHGRARVHGRSASLLEVGTGFQPDLSGRENVFLNGAILGMRRAEVRARFHDIVAFAEVERFIDTPVKRYSSGMFTRLAFSVAAHLRADILLVDEVLAVGDAAFQSRCLDKMDEVTGNGRTVVFVSHRLGAVRRLCPRTLYLRDGTLVRDGDTASVLAEYAQEVSAGAAAQAAAGASAAPATRSHGAHVLGWSVTPCEGGNAHTCVSGDAVSLSVEMELEDAVEDAVLQFRLLGDDGEVVMGACSQDDGGGALRLARGRQQLRMDMALPLVEGHYTPELHLAHARASSPVRVALAPRLAVLARGERRLARHERGVVDGAVSFAIDHAEDTP
jgi:lipopolysaccharide transport system ATP-binding protein